MQVRFCTAIGFAFLPILSGCELASLLDPSRGAIALCEDVLLDELKSPASYQRISASASSHSLAFDEYYKSIGGDECRPFDDGVCEDSKKFLRAVGVKTWILFEKDIRGGMPISEATSKAMDVDFPKSTSKQNWEADLEYQQYVFNLRFNQKYNLPSLLVSIDYDAKNVFGVPLRSQFVCVFAPVNSNSYTKTSIIHSFSTE